MSDKVVQKILSQKIIVIVRKVYGDDLVKLGKAMYAGGIRLIEATFDQADKDCINKTSEAIRLLKANLPDEMAIGAGTVLNVEQVHAAYDAGGEFIISPNVKAEVIAATKSLGMVSIPGAMTPTEILDAHDAGADFVKLFPAGYLGFGYIKDILAPISHVKLVATGGVTEENLPNYLEAGFVGAGISGRLTDKKLIAENNFAELENRARCFSGIAESK